MLFYIFWAVHVREDETNSEQQHDMKALSMAERTEAGIAV